MYFDDKTEDDLCDKIENILVNLPETEKERPINVVYMDPEKYRKLMISKKPILFFAVT